MQQTPDGTKMQVMTGGQTSVISPTQGMALVSRIIFDPNFTGLSLPGSG